eukprot:scaffold195291_cov16-Tisochrysis_lutea.AAC.2
MHDAHPATWINNVPAQHNEQLLLAQHNEQLNNVPAQHIEQLLLAEHGTTKAYKSHGSMLFYNFSASKLSHETLTMSTLSSVQGDMSMHRAEHLIVYT